MNARSPAQDDFNADRVWQLSGFGAAELADNARVAGNGAVAGVLMLAGFVVLALWLTVGLSLQRDDTHETQQAEADIGNLALAFAEHGARQLVQADQLARTVRAELRRPGPRLDLGALLRGVPGDSIVQLSVIGTDGLTLASSHPSGVRVDHHERDYFTQCLRGGTEDSAYISKTQLDDATGQWLMQLARRLDDAEGRCSGLVLVSLTPAFVTRFHQQANVGAQGVITLIGLDGQIRARTASGSTLGGQDQSAAELFQDMRAQGNGQTRRVSPIDSVERLYAYRKVEGYPLIAVAAKGADEVFAAGRARGQLWVALGLLLTLVIAVLTLNVLRRARQQAELLQALSLSRHKADMAQELKSRFLLDLADGMRVPMHCILERAELLRDTQGEPHTRAQARLIHDAAQQMCDRFSTMFEPSGPATLDHETLSGAALDQTVGGLQVDTAFDTSRALVSPRAREPS